jgi:hypothetical protein
MIGIREISFGLTGLAWNGGSRFWHDCKGLEITAVVFGLPFLAWLK